MAGRTTPVVLRSVTVSRFRVVANSMRANPVSKRTSPAPYAQNVPGLFQARYQEVLLQGLLTKGIVSPLCIVQSFNWMITMMGLSAWCRALRRLFYLEGSDFDSSCLREGLILFICRFADFWADLILGERNL
jgi:hypothetical protein